MTFSGVDKQVFLAADVAHVQRVVEESGVAHQNQQRVVHAVELCLLYPSFQPHRRQRLFDRLAVIFVLDHSRHEIYVQDTVMWSLFPLLICNIRICVH